MRRDGAVGVVLALVLVFSGFAAAHAGEPHAGESGGNTVFWDAALAVILGNIDVVGAAASVFFVLLAGILLWNVKNREDVHLPHTTLLLLAVLGVAVLFLLATVTVPADEKPTESFGPGMGPMHMKEFYTGLAPRNVERLADFKEMPTVDDIVNDPGNVPPPIVRNRSKTVRITLEAEERIGELAPGTFYYYWTYNGTVPGPVLRVREGDTIVLTLKNEEGSTHNHSIDLHAVNGPGGGAVMTQVPPGGEKTIKFKALNPGFYVYHCGTDNIPTHIANQMFGGIIVEPKGGLPKVDERFAVFQGELYTAGAMGGDGFQPFAPEKMLNEQPTYYTFNGKPHGVTGKHSMEADVNDTVRIFFGNMGNAKISSFHVIGEIFNRVYKGDFETPVEENMETVPVADGQAVVVDFKIDVPGNYIPVDHALARLDRGAWGVLQAAGEEQPSVYRQVE